MSKKNLLSENYKTSKRTQGRRLVAGEQIKSSASKSFIKKQASQMKSVHPSKHYQYTIPLSHSKKASEIRSKMESSVALPKIGK